MLRAALALAAGAMLLALTACGAPGEDALDELREDMTAADGVTVRAAVTSTAGGEYAEYELECTRSGGEYGVTVLAPAEVAGVTATLDLDGGTLGYDGRALAFASPGGVTPITALPELLRRAGERLRRAQLDGGREHLCLAGGHGQPDHDRGAGRGRKPRLGRASGGRDGLGAVRDLAIHHRLRRKHGI